MGNMFLLKQAVRIRLSLRVVWHFREETLLNRQSEIVCKTFASRHKKYSNGRFVVAAARQWRQQCANNSNVAHEETFTIKKRLAEDLSKPEGRVVFFV